MANRRTFIRSSFFGSLGLSLASFRIHAKETIIHQSPGQNTFPVVISTWSHGIDANKAAWEVLFKGGKALDAVEKGVMVSEADPAVTSVGYGGWPDAEGNVTLDACIMDEYGNCGSVAYLQNIKHPVSVARLVMEKTPHVMLAGQGALRFAKEQGFFEENLLTEEARLAWEKWKDGKKDKENAGEGHDTIGMLAIDREGNLAGACTTSGLAFKIPGRVGDSPIAGAGLYVDNQTGGAVATGTGELVMKTLGSFLIVELMRNGMDPQNACNEAILRIMNKYRLQPDQQVGYLAINKSGIIGACSVRQGFNYALYQDQENKLLWADYLLKSLQE
jgi:isoaspartyl peptidase/L-asparaginase-like protein (Ntn-hydrolase superfamily)